MKLTSTQKSQFRRVRRLAQMQKMSPVEFEHFVGWLYQKKGYRVGTTVVSGDEGVDLTLRRWGKRTVVQVKRYKGTVGQPVVRDLYGAMVHTGAREAHVVTSGRFSRQAEAWAAGKPIVLVDGNDLVAWVNKGHRLQSKGQGKRVYFFSPWRILLMVLLIAGIFATTFWYWDSNYRHDNNDIIIATVAPYPAQTTPNNGGISPPLPPIQPTKTPSPNDNIPQTATPVPPISVTLAP